MSPRSSPIPVANIMTRRVRTAGPDRPVEEVFDMLKEERCHHVPIVEEHRPVGMISARDVVHLARRQEGDQFCIGLTDTERARDVMNEDLVTIHVDESVDTAIDRIGRGDIHALIVVDDDDRLAGIVTHNDLLHYLVN
ncbi:MAG: hypothetical protein CL908_15770 [Deltaproteobacteria bacterium]|nr:hypothetical protein [Deltaproteobacteria bacterium]